MKTQLKIKLLLITFAFFCLTTNAQISSASSGAWNSGATWVGGVVPTSSDDVTILSSHIVTVETTQACDDLTVNSGATLNVQTGALLSSGHTVLIEGTLSMTDGVLNSGDATSEYFQITGGTLNFSGGTINVAGRYKQNVGAEAYLSGSGTINVSTVGEQSASTISNFAVTGAGIFSISNGSTVQIIIKYGNSTDKPEITFSPTTSDFDGGSFVIENASAVSDIYIDSDMPIYNIESDVGTGNVFHYHSGCDFSMNNLTITSGNVQVDAGAEVSINGTAGLGGDEKFTIESTSVSSTASVIFNTAPANTITIQRYYTAAEWHLFGVPVSGITANDLYLNDSPDVWITKFGEASNSWTYITNLDDALNQNSGYMYWIDGAVDQTINFTGNITASDQSTSLTNSGSGWNALGNPFTSALDWDLGIWDPNTITTGTVYVWDQDYDVDGEYITWNGSAGNLSNGIIPLGQGFFVEASNAGNFTIPEAARAHNNQAFYKSVEEDEPSQYVRLQLVGENCGNTVFVGFPENGTEEFDYRGDATKRFSTSPSPQLFIMENGVKLSTNANTPLSDEVKTVPLHLVQILEGNYSLTISDLDQLPNIKITLEDLKTGITQDLIRNNIYDFDALPDDNPERFLLHFMSSPDGIDNYEPDLIIDIYSYGKDIYVHSTKDGVNNKANVFIYDLIGRKIVTQNIQGEALVKIPVQLNNLYVIVKVVDRTRTKTKMVFIK